MNTNEIMNDLVDIEGVLSDIETIELPWSDYERASIGVDWDAVIGRLSRMQAQTLSDDILEILAGIKKRIQEQKQKILILDFVFPELN